MAVVVAGILVAGYAVWVIRDVSSSGPDVEEPSSSTRSITESPSPSASPTATPPAPIGPVRRAVAGADTVLVIGDASGDRMGEWVDLWSQGIADSQSKPRQVSLHTWDVVGQAFVTSSVRGTGPLLDLWNLSYPGTAADYATHLDGVPKKPGAVIYSLGHDRGQKALARAVRTTTVAITDKWGKVPTAYVLQNPATGPRAKQQAAAVKQVRELAATDNAPVLDVNAAFRKSGDLAALLLDGALPNPEGSRVWADAVTASLSR